MEKKQPVYKKTWFWIVIGIFIFLCWISAGFEEPSQEGVSSSSSSSIEQIVQEENLSKWGKKLKSLGINPDNETVLLNTLPDITLLDKGKGTKEFLATANETTYYVVTNTENDIISITTTEYLSEFRTTLYPENKEPEVSTYTLDSIMEDWFFDMRETSSKYNDKSAYITINCGEWYHYSSINDKTYLCYLIEYDYTKFVKVIFQTQESLNASKTYQWGWDKFTVCGKIVEYNNDGIVIYAYDIVNP